MERHKNLGERRKEKENKEKRAGVEATSDGYLLYPEEKVEITVEEALALADTIIRKYRDPKVLFEDFSSRERANAHRLGRTAVDDDTLKRDITSDMETQRSFAKLSTREGLLRVFATHSKNPKHYYGIMLLACAEELRKKFKASIP